MDFLQKWEKYCGGYKMARKKGSKNKPKQNTQKEQIAMYEETIAEQQHRINVLKAVIDVFLKGE